MGRKTFYILLCEHISQSGHFWPFTLASSIVVQHLFQIVDPLTSEHRSARIGAIAVEPMTTVAALGPFLSGQRLADIWVLGLLRRIKGTKIFHCVVIKRSNHTFHCLIGARSALVGVQRRCEILGISSG